MKFFETDNDNPMLSIVFHEKKLTRRISLTLKKQ